MKIYDVCLFNEEKDMLYFRLEQLNKHIDQFVILESNITFSGISKPYHFLEVKDDLELKYPGKIHYIQIKKEFFPSVINSAWDRETFQRNYARDYLLDVTTSEDLIFLSDLDEIYSFKRKEAKTITTPSVYSMVMYYYNFLCRNKQRCLCTCVFKRSLLETKTLQEIRSAKFSYHHIYRGWHLSYFMPPKMISDKIKAFSHQEYNSPQYTEPDIINVRIKKKFDLYNRKHENWESVHIDQYDLPSKLDNVPEYWLTGEYDY